MLLDLFCHPFIYPCTHTSVHRCVYLLFHVCCVTLFTFCIEIFSSMRLFRCAPLYGRNGMFSPCSTFALGRVSEQILQGCNEIH